MVNIRSISIVRQYEIPNFSSVADYWTWRISTFPIQVHPEIIRTYEDQALQEVELERYYLLLPGAGQGLMLIFWTMEKAIATLQHVGIRSRLVDDRNVVCVQIRGATGTRVTTVHTNTESFTIIDNIDNPEVLVCRK